MNSDEPIGEATLSADVLLKSEEEWLARLALMKQLHASLSGSREALLALDLEGIEQGTREQVGLSVKLAANISQAKRRRRVKIGLPLEVLGEVEPKTEHERKPEITARMRVERIEEELRQSQLVVLQALRLQSALLVRAQWKLGVLANMLAGPSVNYGPPLARRSALPPHGFRFTRGGEI